MIVTTTERQRDLVDDGYGDNPFALYDNLGASATLSGTATLSGGDRANVVSEATQKFWKPSVGAGGTAQVVFDMGSAETVSCVGICNHNIASLGGTVRVGYSDDGTTYTNITDEHAPADGSPIVFRFRAQTHRYWRIIVGELTAGDPLAIAVVYIGQEMIFERRLYQGFAPPITSTTVELQNNVSEGGNRVGVAVVRRGDAVSASFDYLTAAWVRETALPFIEAFNNGKAFFWGWRPNKYAQDVQYCWRDDSTIVPENSGPRDLMSFSMTARAHVYG